MGVGEDEAIGDAISVTIIATGFDTHQQNDITNVETKKVIHDLEKDQKIQHDLNFVIPDELNEDSLEPIVYDLVEEDRALQDIPNTMDLITTSDKIKSFEVEFEEVIENILEEDFIINEISSNENKDDMIISDDQTSLTFDLPISTTKQSNIKHDEVEVFKLEDNINSNVVDDYIELVSVTNVVTKGEGMYILDDHIVLEQTDEKFDDIAKDTIVEPELELEVDQEMILTKVTLKESKVSSAPKKETNPFNNPISKTLRDRSDERRQKLKVYNYKFNASKIDEFEKEPAYKRQGIELSNSNDSEAHISRTSITLDDNEDIQLRSNNSFLHDNVD